MKINWKVTGIIAGAALVGALVLGGTVLAQSPENYQGFMGRGFGMMGGGWGQTVDHDTMHKQMEQVMGFDMDSMEEIMHPAIAEALGLSETEFEAEMDAGKTMFDIAAEQGIDINTVWEKMQSTRTEALQKAVEDGTLTQDQADWMSQMGNLGAGMIGGGMHGRGDFDGTTGPGSMMGGWNNSNTQIQ